MVGTIRDTGQITGGMRVEGGNQAGELGGMDVRVGQGRPARSGLAKIGDAIKSFFSKIGDKITQWKEARAERKVEKATANVQQSITSVKQDLMSGQVTGRTFNSLLSALNNGAKINTDSPGAAGRTAIRDMVSGMSNTELTQLASKDLNQFAAQIGHKFDTEMGNQINLAQRLNEVGLGGENIGQMQQQGAGRKEQLMGLVAEFKQAVIDERTDRFEKGFGGLITVGEDGKFARQFFDMDVKVGDAPQSPSSWLEEIATKKLEGGGEPTIIMGTEITGEAKADWPRMNVNFRRPDGEVVTSRAHGPEEAETKLEDCTMSLVEIAGGDEAATKTLSSLLTQHGWRDIVRGFVGEDGVSSVPIRPLPSGYDQATIEGPNGPVVVDHPGQIGDAEITVSRRPDGNYSISVEWLMVGNGVGVDLAIMSPDNPTSGALNDQEKGNPINALGVRMTSELVVSGEMASQGRVAILESGFSHQVFGQFKALSH